MYLGIYPYVHVATEYDTRSKYNVAFWQYCRKIAPRHVPFWYRLRHWVMASNPSQKRGMTPGVQANIIFSFPDQSELLHRDSHI